MIQKFRNRKLLENYHVTKDYSIILLSFILYFLLFIIYYPTNTNLATSLIGMFIVLTSWVLSLKRALIVGAFSLMINYSLIHLVGGFKIWENWIPLRLYYVVIIFVVIFIIGWLSDLRIELSVKNQQLIIRFSWLKKIGQILYHK